MSRMLRKAKPPVMGQQPGTGKRRELPVRTSNMTDHEWAEAFVSCKIEGIGSQFAETVDVLVKKLAQVREEAAYDSEVSSTRSTH
jgi:hypothetical protein